MSPDAALKFWKRNLDKTDPALLDWVVEFVRPDDVVWDVGANIGLFTFAAANVSGAGGHVLAIEPDAKLVELLRRSGLISRGRNAPVTILPVAISERLDVAEFEIAARGRSANHLAQVAGGSQTGGTRERILTMTVTLDWLLERFPAPRVLKIDIEGGELNALRGARNVLAQAQPILLCEVHAVNAPEVGDLLRGHGYTMFDLERQDIQRQSVDLPAFNTLALPAN